ncbi:MAG: ribonuclease H-like domain-containing protein, partial [Candidatus Dadabacteria bacterium]|nr:ribonuclease H-like domain-containing protein [Candidatus Dadabacteria bacterium]
PWKDDFVFSNITNEKDSPWHDAKKDIAKNRIPGGDTALLYKIGLDKKSQLAELGYPNYESIINAKSASLPLEKCKGIGPKIASQLRAILSANQKGIPSEVSPEDVPSRQDFEFYIDYEFFTNLNVNFETQWPDLEGCEMIFMIGVGWEENEQWNFKTFTAAKEDQQEELEMIEEFLEFLENKTENKLTEDNVSVLYHWSSAEVWQTRKVIERHSIDKNSPIHSLPWYDLLNVFNNGPASVPGAWGFGLKEVAKSLGKLYPQYNPEWPGDLDAGLTAMVMGWKAYENKKPLETIEMSNIKEYLEADCKALWNVLKWLRSGKGI